MHGLLDVFLCVHKTAAHDHGARSLPADFRISSRDEEHTLPKSFAEKLKRGGKIIPGFTDLTYMPMMLRSPLRTYDYIWLMEYDVDYAGNWKNFFAPLLAIRADFLATTMFPRRQCPGWPHWQWLEVPPEVSAEHYICSYLPIARFSRSMLKCSTQAMQDGSWRGHTEGLYAPSLAITVS